MASVGIGASPQRSPNVSTITGPPRTILQTASLLGQTHGAFLTPAWKWWVLPPGLLTMLASLGFALIAFSLEERINPRL